MSSRKQKNKKAYKEKRAAHLAKKRREKALFQIEGTVRMSSEGFCFVTAENVSDIAPGARVMTEDIFVKASKTKGALNGDRVVVDVTKSGTTAKAGRRYEGVITQIVERSKKPFVGFLHVVGNQAWVLMQSRVMPYDIALSEIPEGAKHGYKVAAVVDDWPRGESNPVGHIVDVLGLPGENDTEMHAILAEYGLPYRFEPFIDKAAEKIPAEITRTDIAERKDFRKVLTFTIDPSDAKDFDDAISWKKLKNGNTELGVHIADVTHYITPDTVIDKEAQNRGTSVYLVDRTVPMLPEKLCNNLCSLRPHEDKLCFSVVFELDAEAQVKRQWMGRTVINSDERLCYEQAQAVIDAAKNEKASAASAASAVPTVPAAPASAPTAPVSAPVAEAIKSCWDLASKLRKARFSSGAISFERPEMKVICDEKGRPVEVVQKVSSEANFLIEEFMLLANRTVAQYVALDCHNNTFVYRVHDEPNQVKLDNLRTFVKTLGYKLPAEMTGHNISAELNSLFNKTKDTPEASAIELMSLRCMAKAKYDTENIGHYGLAFKYYTHFTSPIRRYPDMMVHRLLAGYLAGGQNADKSYFTAQCVHASQREQLATDAERASVKYKMVEYMQDKLGYEFDGVVSGITEWGMFVEALPSHIEGMVALRDIKSDYFEFDEAHYCLVGRHTRRKYTVGSQVKIRLVRADLDSKQIDFELLETEGKTKVKKK